MQMKLIESSDLGFRRTVCVIIRLIISRSSHDARVHLNFTRNSIPGNVCTTRTVRAVTDRNDHKLFHQIIKMFTMCAKIIMCESYNCHILCNIYK